jgi:hypothetical protein
MKGGIMKKILLILSVFLFFSLVNSLLIEGNALGVTIDFETVPSSIPSDKLAISNQYEALFGVTFSTSTGGTPFLEKVGGTDSGDGFINDNRGDNPDIAAIGFESQLGDYYLRLGTVDLLSKPVPSLIISYSTPVSAASGQIWDIDKHTQGFEQWIVTSFDASNNPIDTQASPIGLPPSDISSLDGKPWTWSFDHGTTFDIYSIQVIFTDAPGSKSSGIGLAFDNFSPSSPEVPIPAAIWLLSSGLIGVIGFRKIFRKD